MFPWCPCVLAACPLVLCPMACLLGGICPQQPPPGAKMLQPACSCAECKPQLYIPAHLLIPSCTTSSCSRRAHIDSRLFSYMSTLSCLPAHDLNAETSLRTATVFWGHIFYATFGLSLFFLSSESSPRSVGARSAFTLPGSAVTLERGGMPLARCLLGPQRHSQHPVPRLSAQSRLLRARTLLPLLLLRPRPCLGARAPHGSAEPGSPARCLATPAQMAVSGPSTANHV